MFISLESTEGAGKGVLSRIATKAFELSRTPFCHTRQPGGTPYAERLREIFLWADQKITLEEEVLLLAVARKRCLEEVIKPALAQGEVVLCERWNASTVAYQGTGRNMHSSSGRVHTTKFIYDTFKKLGLTEIVPDVSFLITVDTQTGLNRKVAQTKLDNFEQEGLDFHSAVAQCMYRTHQVRNNWMMKDSRIINSDCSIEELAHAFLKELHGLGVIKKYCIRLAIKQGLENA